MKFLKEYSHTGLSLLLGCYFLVSFTLLKNDLKVEMDSLKKDINTLKSLQLIKMPLMPDLKDAYFFKDYYCGKNDFISLKVRFANSGKVSFQHKILKKGVKDDYPVSGEWWYLNGNLVLEVKRGNSTRFIEELKDVYMDETGGILNVHLEDMELSIRACNEV